MPRPAGAEYLGSVDKTALFLNILHTFAAGTDLSAESILFGPVNQLQSFYSLEMPGIVCDEDMAMGDALRRYKYVGVVYQRSTVFMLGIDA